MTKPETMIGVPATKSNASSRLAKRRGGMWQVAARSHSLRRQKPHLYEALLRHLLLRFHSNRSDQRCGWKLPNRRNHDIRSNRIPNRSPNFHNRFPDFRAPNRFRSRTTFEKRTRFQSGTTHRRPATRWTLEAHRWLLATRSSSRRTRFPVFSSQATLTNGLPFAPPSIRTTTRTPILGFCSVRIKAPLREKFRMLRCRLFGHF